MSYLFDNLLVWNPFLPKSHIVSSLRPGGPRTFYKFYNPQQKACAAATIKCYVNSAWLLSTPKLHFLLL